MTLMQGSYSCESRTGYSQCSFTLTAGSTNLLDQTLQFGIHFSMSNPLTSDCHISRHRDIASVSVVVV